MLLDVWLCFDLIRLISVCFIFLNYLSTLNCLNVDANYKVWTSITVIFFILLSNPSLNGMIDLP